LELSAEKINGKIISPNEEFSYNLTVGARTIEAGYKEAKIYSNGQVVDGIGGGICQLSSTLYNAAFFANLDITERYNHQFLTSYVKEGRDATVVYGVKDFKFKNSRNFPIKIETTVNSGVVTCSIYGIKEDPEYDVSFDVETVSFEEAPIKYEFDSSLSLGEQKIKQSGSNSMTVNVYKVVKLNGSIVSKTFIYQDIYKSLDKIVVKRAD
jgi:vanW